MMFFSDDAAKRDTFLYLVFAFILGGSALAWGCYDPNSPHLPPCPDGGNGYTDPAGCFGHVLDGGPDAR